MELESLLADLTRRYNDAVVEYPDIPEAELVTSDDVYTVRLVSDVDGISRIVVVTQSDGSITVEHDFFDVPIESTLQEGDDWSAYLQEVFARFIRWLDSVTIADLDETVFDPEEPRSNGRPGYIQATEEYRKKVRVVRGGKVTTIRKKVHKRHVRLSPAQRMALRKAVKKAHTVRAQKKRAKSMKIRQRRGL